MRTAILDPFSGIAGDMTLGALLGVGLDAEWLRALPAKLGLDDV
ncbi:MAG: nickel insertion protein, partial [Gemmatimonadaceae bacterium]